MMTSSTQPSNQTQTLPVLDHTKLLDATAGDPSFVEELLNIYLKDVKERLERINQYIAIQDYKSLKLELHTIKGSSASIGASQMHNLIKQAEAQLTEEANELFHQLLQSIPPTLESFQQYIQHLQKIGYKL